MTKEVFESKLFYSPDGCWYWTGACYVHGYGVVSYNGKKILAHRASFLMNKGDIPKGICVCHRCDNILCVNPDHLFLGTQADNVKDMIDKKRFISSPGSGNGMAKYSDVEVLLIRELRESGFRVKEICRLMNASSTTVSDITNRKTWTHI